MQAPAAEAQGDCGEVGRQVEKLSPGGVVACGVRDGEDERAGASAHCISDGCDEVA